MESKVKSQRSSESGAGAIQRRFRPSHYDLIVWQEAMRLAKDVYAASATFPPEDRYGLTSQLRRAAVSVPSNIAEGAARGSLAELGRFLLIARGSLLELDTQLWLARELGYSFDHALLRTRIEALCIKLNSLIVSSRRSKAKVKLD
jgi:four helix bundle protein